MFTIYFTVSVESPIIVHKNESIFVVGSHESIGNWHPNNALKLIRNDNGTFTGTISLNSANIIKFRYFIGYYLESELTKSPSLIISKWETHLIPRCVIPAIEASKTRVCRANVSDIFGFFGGKSVISDGWISNEDQNQILLTVTGDALKFYKSRHIEEKYGIKVVPLDLRNKHDSPDDVEGCDDAADETLPSLPSYSCTEIAALCTEDPHFHEQRDCGELFQNSVDYFVFRTCSVAVEYLGFRIEVYSPVKNSLIAIGYALPSTLHDTYGKASAPLLTTKGIPVGKIYFNYLFVRVLPNMSDKQTMEVSYSRHWKKRTTLEVGHRGMGNSYTKCAVARENTLHSLNGAAKNGADFVEFDVHLTKDKIPIVYHDFHVMVSVAKRSPSIAENLHKISTDSTSSNNGNGTSRHNIDFYQLAVKDLKLNQLKLLHLDHVNHQNDLNDKDIHKVTGEHDEAEEHRPFPTLVEAFQNVSDEVGFNIEVKYPMMQINGVHECENYFERNLFLDIILAEVLNTAGKRRIVFSSFDPDICTMLSLKQNKYPVLFLCVGDTVKHTPYVDERTRTSMTAVKFVVGMELMGVNFNSECVLRDPTPIIKAREYGLISFVWGDELVDKNTVHYFKKTLFVNGVIYDRIGENEQRSNIFTLEKKMKDALFFSKKLPSPVTTPRSNSIHHLNDKQSNVNNKTDNKPIELVKIEKQEPKEWPLLNQTTAFYNSLEHQIRHINLAVNNNRFISRNSKTNGIEIAPSFGLTTTTATGKN